MRRKRGEKKQTNNEKEKPRISDLGVSDMAVGYPFRPLLNTADPIRLKYE